MIIIIDSSNHFMFKVFHLRVIGEHVDWAKTGKSIDSYSLARIAFLIEKKEEKNGYTEKKTKENKRSSQGLINKEEWQQAMHPAI